VSGWHQIKVFVLKRTISFNLVLESPAVAVSKRQLTFKQSRWPRDLSLFIAGTGDGVFN